MRFIIDGQIFFVKTPSRMNRWVAEEIFSEQLKCAEEQGAFTKDQLSSFLNDKGIWTPEDEKKMSGVKEDLDKLKVGLFEKRFRSKESNMIRQYLDVAKKTYAKLELLRHSYDHLSALGVATACKQRF